MSDGVDLMLKLVSQAKHPYEINIGLYFSQTVLASHPKNHCVPILGVLDLPDDDDLKIIVMPLLREIDDPCFDTVGEVVEMFRQIFEAGPSVVSAPYTLHF